MNLKSHLLITIALFFSLFTTIAQNFNSTDNKWMNGWTNFSPNQTLYPEAQETLPRVISFDTVLRNDIVYLMSGDVYVTPGISLTIPEGTIIRCDHKSPANLIIAKGAKLVAIGTQSSPIVFTSNKAPKARSNGDWGGIIIAGSGIVNTESKTDIIKGNFDPKYTQFGGDYTDQETAILRYVRIEFAGNKSKKDVNGLSLYGLGTNAFVDNVMVSYSAQNSFYINAGKNNIKNLISYKAEENDFFLSDGFKGNLNSIIAVRHPYVTSPKGSFALKIDGHSRAVSYVDPSLVTDVTIRYHLFRKHFC